MKWRKIITPNELHKGMLVSFTTKQDDKVIELWNEQFIVENVVPNTEGKIEIWLKTKENEDLVIYWEEIESMYIPI